MSKEENLLKELIVESSNDCLRAFNEHDEYNINYMLSQEQIKVAALLAIDKDLMKASEKCYINGVSFNVGEDKISPQSIIDSDGGELFEAMIGLDDALAAINSGKPAFFAIENDRHYITIALVPNDENPSKISLQYINSIVNSKVGWDVAETLLEYLKSKGIPIEDSVFDKSIDQQLANCCGLSVASNIASITKAFYNKEEPELFKPEDDNEKEEYYGNYGIEAFRYIREKGIPIAQEIEIQRAEAQRQIKFSEACEKLYVAMYGKKPEKSYNPQEWHEWYDVNKSYIHTKMNGTQEPSNVANEKDMSTLETQANAYEQTTTSSESVNHDFQKLSTESKVELEQNKVTVTPLEENELKTDDKKKTELAFQVKVDYKEQNEDRQPTEFIPVEVTLSQKLAEYFYDSRNIPLTSKAKEIMERDVAKILKPLNNVKRDIPSIVRDCANVARSNSNKESLLEWMKDKMYEIIGYKSEVRVIAKNISSEIRNLITKTSFAKSSWKAASEKIKAEVNEEGRLR